MALCLAACGEAILPAETETRPLTFSLAGCGEAPYWVAVRDGEGDWRHPTRDGATYRFDVAGEDGSLAWVIGVQGMLQVRHLAWNELPAVQASVCAPADEYKSVGVSYRNNVAFGSAYFFSGAFGFQAAAQLAQVRLPAGRHDILGLIYSRSPSFANQPMRGVLLRDDATADGGTLGVMDFAGPQSFVPVVATLTTAEATSPVFAIATGPRCEAAQVDAWLEFPGQSVRTIGLPEIVRQPGDVHIATIRATRGNRVLEVRESYGVQRDRTVNGDAGWDLVPTIGGGRPAATFPASSVPYRSLRYRFGNGAVEIAATAGWLARHPPVLALPTFAGMAVENPAWLAGGAWETESVRQNTDGNLCADGTRRETLIVQGTTR